MPTPPEVEEEQQELCTARKDPSPSKYVLAQSGATLSQSTQEQAKLRRGVIF